MRVIGIDPGKTIGLCLYDGQQVLAAVEAKGDAALLSVRDIVSDWTQADEVTAIAVEWPRIYSKAGNEVADTCIQTGMIWWMLGARELPNKDLVGQWCYRRDVYLYALTRQAIVKKLSEKMGQSVKTDSGVWSALVDLHGGKGIADKRTTKGQAGGPLSLLSGKPHARAALAVAWVAADIIAGAIDTQPVSQ
jgi:hypothetical protein